MILLARPKRRAWLFALALGPTLLAVSAARGYPQADYRNLDPGRPITVEDAQPVEFRALELQFSSPRFARESSGHWLFAFEPEFKWGIWKDTQFGVSSEFVIAWEARNTLWTFRDTQFHLLYNFNQETRRLPAIALRPELTVRSGALGGRREHGALKLIVSKTLHRNRLHLNSSYALGPTEARGRGGELVSRYFYGLGYERTFPLKFVVLLADVYARKPIDHAKTQVVFDIGTRIQLTPTWVFDAGLSSGVLRQSAGPDIGFTFGFSYTFSFRSLFPTGGK